jgi:hypothetical protein
VGGIEEGVAAAVLGGVVGWKLVPHLTTGR